jgi:S-adenosylmethionine hydrolase
MDDKTASGIVALLTDFGSRDYFVGAMKGVIVSINSEAKILDITHDIAPQDISSAAFTLRACYENFPKKTIFVAVVDPRVGSDRKAILVETEKYYFIAPDNGLLSFVYNKNAEDKKFRVVELANERFFLKPVSRTFHGRDIFAACAAHLSNGVNPSEFGEEINDYVIQIENKPRKLSGGETEAQIIHTDRFGNLITNLRKDELKENFILELGGTKIEKMRTYYAEAEKSEVFMIWGSAGFLEIVVFQDSAEKLLNAKRGQKITVKNLMI